MAFRRKAMMRQGNNWARKLRPFISTGLRLAMRYRGSGSRTQTRSNRGRDYGNLTFQNDEHMIYRRKRAPRRVRKAAKRSFKRFMYNLDRTQGMRTVSITRTGTQSIVPSSGSDAQGCFGISIYGYGSNSATPGTNNNWGNGDMRYIFTAEGSAAPSNTLAAQQLRFRSARLNVTIKNVTGTDNPSSDRGGLVFIDMYHVLARKNSNTSNGGGDFAQLFQDALNRQAVVPNTTVVSAATADGITLFDAPGFGEDVIIKRVRRIRLSDSQVFNTQLRDPGNYVIREDGLMENDVKGNLTEGYVFIYWNASADDTTGIRGTASLEVNIQKAYHYTYTSSNDDCIGRSNLI